MKSTLLLFVLCGLVVQAGATDLVPPGFNPVGDKMKMQGTESKVVVTLTVESSLMNYTPSASPEIINARDAFKSSLKTTPP